MKKDVAGVLCVLPSIPLPANTGGTLRTLHLLRSLDSVFDVTVLAPSSPQADAAGLRQMLRGKLVEVPPVAGGKRWLAKVGGLMRGKPLGYEQYASAALRRALTQTLHQQSFALVHFDHLHTAQLLPCVRKLAPGALTVIDAHNVEAQVVERLANISRVPMRWALKSQARRVRKLEISLVCEADAILACSARDRSLLRWAGAKKVQVVPNGVAFGSLTRRPAPVRRDVIFVGSMDWWPNADAALRLVKDIWPRCAERLGESRLVIAGRNPPQELCALGGGRVEITGTVDSVAPYLATAWASAIPLRAGSGTRLKILEAAAARVPVVATRLAAEGLPLVHGKHVLIAESAQEFADALHQLWVNHKLARELSEAAFEVAQEFDWARVGRGLTDFYGAWLAKSSPELPQASAGA